MEKKISFKYALVGFHYSYYDDNKYYEWIRKINCVIDATNNNGLEIDAFNVSDNDLINLIGLFNHYNFDKSQLDILKTEKNQLIFEKEKTINNGSFQRVYYKKPDEIEKKKNIIVLTPMVFSTREEESIFFYWLKQIKSIEKIEGSGEKLYLYISEDKIKNEKLFLSAADKEEIGALLSRYKFKNKNQFKNIESDLYCCFKIKNLIKKKLIKKKEVIIHIAKPGCYSYFDGWFFFKLSETVCCDCGLKEENGQFILYFDTDVICDNGLKNLFALFDRYEVKNKSQLNIFKNKNNEHLFIENKKKHRGRFQYLHQLSKDPISFFSTKGMIAICCTPLLFYTERDKELFFERIKMIKSLNACELIGPSLYLYFMPNAISKEEILDLMALFDRYELDNYLQLEIFKNEENKDLF